MAHIKCIIHAMQSRLRRKILPIRVNPAYASPYARWEFSSITLGTEIVPIITHSHLVLARMRNSLCKSAIDFPPRISYYQTMKATKCPACQLKRVHKPLKIIEGVGVSFRCKGCGEVFLCEMPTTGVKIPKAKRGRPKKRGRKKGAKKPATMPQEPRPVPPPPLDTPAPLPGSQPLEDDKMEAFCQRCITESCPTQAAIKTWPDLTYGSARTKTWQLLTKADIVARRKFLAGERLEQLKGEVTRVLEGMVARASGRIPDYVTADEAGVSCHLTVNDGVPNPDAIKKLKIKRLFDKDGNEIGQIEEIELHSPDKAAAELLDRVGVLPRAPGRYDVTSGGESIKPVGVIVIPAEQIPTIAEEDEEDAE